MGFIVNVNFLFLIYRVCIYGGGMFIWVVCFCLGSIGFVREGVFVCVGSFSDLCKFFRIGRVSREGFLIFRGAFFV